MAKTYTLERTQFIPRPLREVFPFFSDAENLEAITPPFLQFKILTPGHILMQAGTLIDYRIRLLGIPMFWRTKIETFGPPFRFSDTQVRGPYRLWHHAHEFVETSEGTLMTDLVRYQMPFGPLGILVHAIWTRRTLERIFDYRFQKVAELLGPEVESHRA
ncbi:MAG: SRPBCC family protein [Planctomycetales bacterium]|nr:SRPBCC family protein [Planctomycetales bacterium]